MSEPKDPFGRPLDSSRPTIVPPDEFAARVAERDAEEAALEDELDDQPDDLSDLDEAVEAFDAPPPEA